MHEHGSRRSSHRGDGGSSQHTQSGHRAASERSQHTAAGSRMLVVGNAGNVPRSQHTQSNYPAPGGYRGPVKNSVYKKSKHQEAVDPKEAAKLAKAADLVFVQPQEVIFTGPFSDWIYTFVTIINPSKKMRMVFKFKSNCKRNFTVHPVFGFIEKGGAAAIKVTCRPLKPEWLSSHHRLTVVAANAPTDPDAPDEPNEIWAMDGFPAHKKTIFVPVKYRRDDGSEIGGSVADGGHTVLTNDIECTCKAGECTCGPAQEPICTCGVDHDADVVTTAMSKQTQLDCQTHGTYSAKSHAGATPVCTCVAEGQSMTQAAEGAMAANCDSHRPGGVPTAACTCFGASKRQPPPVSASQAEIAKSACGAHGTATARANAGSTPVCTCVTEGSQASMPAIQAVTANCDTHGTLAVKNGKAPGAVCTCFKSSGGTASSTQNHAASCMKTVSKASSSMSGPRSQKTQSMMPSAAIASTMTAAAATIYLTSKPGRSSVKPSDVPPPKDNEDDVDSDMAPHSDFAADPRMMNGRGRASLSHYAAHKKGKSRK